MLLLCATVEKITAGWTSMKGLREKGGEKLARKPGEEKALTVAPDAGSAERT